MGYCISQRDSQFSISRDKFGPLVDAVEELMGKAKDLGGGGSPTNRVYSWVNTDEVLFAIKQYRANTKLSAYVQNIFESWRWNVEFDELDDIYMIEFTGEKMGDDLYFFNAIAPCVDNGSFIEMQGEEGEIWRWTFNAGLVDERYATISWE